jgi:hypothetical protein
MKTLFRYSVIIVFLTSMGIQRITAKTDYSKVIKKEFAVNHDAKLIIENKFGQVHCDNWDKNSISIEVTITVQCQKESTATELFDKISIVMNGSPSQVEARTVFTDGDIKGRNKIQIDYKISMPASINLDLTNKFGDIYINELAGTGKIDLSYGNMEVNKLTNSDNLLNIKFSKANIESIQGAVLSLKYSDIQIEYAGSLRLDSKYSTIDAAQVISITGSYEGGKLNIENSTAVDSKSKFSDLHITRIAKTLNLDLQYGNCDVGEMPADFTNISILNKYGNVSIGISKDASYNLDADLKYCDLDFPEDKANMTKSVITNTTKSFKATVGKIANPTAKVTIQSEYGNVSLE